MRLATVLGALLRGLLGVSIIAAALAVGVQLRASREHLGSQAASAGSARASVTPSPWPTVSAVPTPAATATPVAAKAVRTVVPTPVATPFTGVPSQVSGIVTAGGKPAKGAQVMVYPSNSFNHGPTPVPPASAMAVTDDRGFWQVALPPGTYRVGAYRSYYDPLKVPDDGFAPYTWYGDGYMIGFGKDLVVSGNSSGVDIAMLRSITVAGRVVGRDGVGVPNAQVGLSRPFGGITFPLTAGTTDGAGRFTLSIVAMPVTFHARASGRSSETWASFELDLRADRTDLSVTLDRGNIVSGTLRDSAGRPLPNLSFGVWSGNDLVSCASCGGRTDSDGRFSITVPSASLRFKNWAQPSEPELTSKEYVVSGDLSLDPVMQAR